MEEIDVEVEHHFMYVDILDEGEWVDAEVPIIVEKYKREFFIENDKDNVVINCGGLSVTLKREHFEQAVREWQNRK